MRASFSGGHKVAFETIAGTVKKLDNNEDFDMDEKQVKELIEATMQPYKDANAKLTAELEAERKATAEFKAQQEADDKEAEEYAIRLARKRVTEALDSAVKSKSMTPATRELYERQIGVDDDYRVVGINVEEIKKMFSVPDNSNGGAFSRSEDENGTDAEQALLDKTYENMADTGERNFKASFTRVCAANPKLHREYLDSNGVK